MIFIIRTYPVLVHCVPTEFETLRDSSDVSTLLADNEDTIPHPSSLQCAEFLTSNHTQSQTKTCSSLILHFTDLTVTNSCITHCTVLCGHLLPMAKFIRHPPQCFNCFRS